MASYTQNYQLHQWEPEDPFLRTDFNEDLEKIDSALKEANTGPACVTGSYLGTGQDMTISLGFRPSFLVLIPVNRPGSYSSDLVCMLGTEEAMVEFPRYSSSGIYRSVTFSAAGITVPADSNMTSEGVQFSYAAFY